MTEDFEKILKEMHEPVLRKQINSTFGRFKPFTTEQQAQYDKRVAEQEEWEEKFQKLYDLEVVKNPVLQLHKKGLGDCCDGCDYGGYESEPPSWPCRTVMLILTGDADYHFVPPTPYPKVEYIQPKGTVTYTISPRNLEFGAE